MKKYIYFTGTDSTKRVMEALGADKDNSINLGAAVPDAGQLKFDADDLIFVGFPVYGGRVPAVVLDRLANLSGNGCKFVVVGVYGNRHYDDALNEMQAFAEKHGCKVIATIAAVAEHNMARTVATGRPDANDIARLREIGEHIASNFENLKPLPARPEETYKEYRALPEHPMATDDCTECGICAEECPMQVISHENPRIVDASQCINCMRCTYVCPAGARQFSEQTKLTLKNRLEPKCVERREAEAFLG